MVCVVFTLPQCDEPVCSLVTSGSNPSLSSPHSSPQSGLEQQGTHTAHFTLFPNEDLEVLVDNSDSEQYSSTRPNSSHEVSQHRECSDTQTSECCCSGYVSVELVYHRSFPVSSHNHLLFSELFRNIFS